MIIALKPELAAVLSEQAQREVLAAFNVLTQERLEPKALHAHGTLKHYLCDLVPGPVDLEEPL
jgi:hypothetical protein